MSSSVPVSYASIREMAARAGAKFPDLVAAQFALESGWGKSPSGRNNFFGQKGPGTTKTTQEFRNGRYETIDDSFRDFDSPQAAVQYLVDRWYKDYKGYKGVNNAPDLASAARMLKAQGYATSPTYASRLIEIASGGGKGAPPPIMTRTGGAASVVTSPADPLAPPAAMPAATGAAQPVSAEAATAAAGLESSLLTSAELAGLASPAGARLAKALVADLPGASGPVAAAAGVDAGLDLVSTLAAGEQGQAVAASGRMAGQGAATAGRGGRFNVIEYLTGDKSHSGYRGDHGGGNYHEHLAFGSKAERDAAMAKLKAAGIQIGSINDGKHAPNSYHYQDLAFDVPAAQVPVGKEPELSRRVRAILGIS